MGLLEILHFHLDLQYSRIIPSDFIINGTVATPSSVKRDPNVRRTRSKLFFGSERKTENIVTYMVDSVYKLYFKNYQLLLTNFSVMSTQKGSSLIFDRGNCKSKR